MHIYCDRSPMLKPDTEKSHLNKGILISHEHFSKQKGHSVVQPLSLTSAFVKADLTDLGLL